MLLLVGQVESQRCEDESFQITKKMLQLIINNCSGTFYIFNREMAEEIKISHRNKKNIFNVFCLYYNKEFHILIPFNGALIGKYKERFNCGNEIKKKLHHCSISQMMTMKVIGKA